jgi:hypothetical protein
VVNPKTSTLSLELKLFQSKESSAFLSTHNGEGGTILSGSVDAAMADKENDEVLPDYERDEGK